MSAASTSTQKLLDSPVLKSAIRKSSFRLMPMLVILYVVAFLDRTNVGFAEAALEVDRGITAGAYALGAGIFFIGYALFEIPSNLLLTKFGAKVWLARIAITSDELSEVDQEIANENAIDEIVFENVTGVHKKVTRDTEEE